MSRTLFAPKYDPSSSILDADALKLLRETCLGKVRMICIDPPYNTGSDLICEDDFDEGNQTGNKLLRSLQQLPLKA